MSEASPASRAADPTLPREGAKRAQRSGSGEGKAPSLLNVGYGNLLMVHRIVAVATPGSSPMKRLRDEAQARGKLVDATHGRRTRSIVVTDSDHVILSAFNPDTLAARLFPAAGDALAEDPTDDE